VIEIDPVALAAGVVAGVLVYVVWQHVVIRRQSTWIAAMGAAMKGIAAGDVEVKIDSEGDVRLRRIR